MNAITRRARTRGRESGFTLIEALIAMIILVVGLVAIANLFVVAASSNQIGNYTTITTAAASEVMERLKAIPFTTLITYSGPYTRTDPWNVTDWEDTNFTAVSGSPSCEPPSNLANVTTCTTQLPGVGTVISHWKIVDPAAGGTLTRFVLVRSEVLGLLGRGTRAQFATFRACVASSCP